MPRGDRIARHSHIVALRPAEEGLPSPHFENRLGTTARRYLERMLEAICIA